MGRLDSGWKVENIHTDQRRKTNLKQETLWRFGPFQGQQKKIEIISKEADFGERSLALVEYGTYLIFHRVS